MSLDEYRFYLSIEKYNHNSQKFERIYAHETILFDDDEWTATLNMGIEDFQHWLRLHEQRMKLRFTKT